MITMLFKHKAITAALIGVLSLTACGQQKSTYGGAPGQNASGKAASKSADTKGTLGGGLPNPSSQSNSDEPPLPEPIPSTVTSTGGQKSSSVPAKTTPVKTAPVKATQTKASTVTPAPEKEESAPVEVSSKKGTGGTKGDLIYTTSSTDDLMSSLRARTEKATRAERDFNAQTASSITSAKLSIHESGEVEITVKMSEGSSIKTYNVIGDLNEGRSTALNAIGEIEDSRTTGAKVLHGSLKCLDADGGCENTLVRMTVSSKGSKAFINIVFRKTIADSYFKLPGRESGNPEYTNIETFIKNSIEGIQTDDRINVIRMNTFEVVNGRSGFDLTIEGMNKEVLGFSGPLLASSSGAYVSIPLARLGVNEAPEASLDVADTIGEARLVSNNGQGQLRLVFKMRPHGNYAQDEFTGIFTRRIKPVIDPTESN